MISPELDVYADRGDFCLVFGVGFVLASQVILAGKQSSKLALVDDK